MYLVMKNTDETMGEPSLKRQNGVIAEAGVVIMAPHSGTEEGHSTNTMNAAATATAPQISVTGSQSDSEPAFEQQKDEVIVYLQTLNPYGEGSSRSVSPNPGARGSVDRTYQLHTYHAIPQSSEVPLEHFLGNDRIPTRWALPLSGDEGKEGPIFNYARIFTSYRLWQIIHDAFSNTLHNFEKNYNHDSQQQQQSHHRPVRDEVHIVNGTASQLTKIYGLSDPSSCLSYLSIFGHTGRTGTGDNPTSPIAPAIQKIIYRDMFAVAIAALFIQWGTTGPSIIIAYLTPTTGLGCRSGSYMLYGILATVSWLLLVTASIPSHLLMLRVQAGNVFVPSTEAPTNTGHRGRRSQRDTSSNNNNTQRDNTQNSTNRATGTAAPTTPATLNTLRGPISYLYALTRISGYVIASLNALWLLLSSVFDLAGLYETCWCNADVLGLRGRSQWVMLWETTAELSKQAMQPWVGGICFVAVVCLVASAVVWLGCKTPDDEE